jgi:hypothetical protein
MRSWFCLLALLAALRGNAQTVSSPAAISGTVQDQSGGAVSGAVVTLKRGGDLQGRTASSGVAGEFQFDKVATGDYELTVRYEGFNPSTTRLKVTGRPIRPLKIVLLVAGLRQELTVDTQGLVVSADPGENLDTVKLERRALDNLPVLDQDYVAAVSRSLSSASLGTGGVTLVVDGMETSEKGVSASAILEVKINQNPYSAEYSRPGRGRIEIITRPGSSEYHGAFNFMFRDHHLNARDPFAQSRPPEQRRIFEGSLSGPLGDGRRSSFMISGNRAEEDLESIVFALTPSGEMHANVPQPRRNTFLSARVNRQVGENHTLSFRYEFTDEASRNQGVGGFNLPETGANASNREHHIYFNHRAVITKKLVNEFYLRSGRHWSPAVSVNRGPRIVVQDAFSAGGGQADRLSTENHAQFNEILSWSRGKHFIKTGMNAPDISRRGSNDRTNRDGTFYFSTLSDYLAGRPFSFVRQQGEGRLAFWEMVMGWFFQDDVRVRPNLSLAFGLRYDYQNYFPDHDNVSPRASFAYAPGRSRKTVFRGGTGLFYDRTGPGTIADLLRFDGHTLRRFVISNPGYPNPVLGGTDLSAEPSSIVRLAPGVRIPYTTQFSLGVERQVRKNTTLTATYIGTRVVSAFRSRDVNAPLPPAYLGRPNPYVGVLRQVESSGRVQGDSLELALKGDITRFFTGMAQYAYGRAYNDTGGINSLPANSRDLTGEWARADFDERHRLNLLGTLRQGKLLNLGIGLLANSGRPYSVTTGRDDNGDGVANDRPAGVRRNSLQGPGYLGLDLRWSRDWFLSRTRKDKGPIAGLSVDGFNVLNRVNYPSLVGNRSSPFFGRAVAAKPSRRLQISVRFRF